MQDFQIRIIDSIDDILNDNADIQVEFADGRHYIATFFTISNIQKIMEKDKGTGECLNGTYFWCSNMIIVRDLQRETIENSVRDLLEQEEFENIFLQCSPHEDDKNT